MTTLPEEAVTLWAVSIHGPDDLIAAPDYLSAVRMANAFNAWWLDLKTKQPHNDAIDARMWAIPTDWPGNDAQGHAVELSKPHPEYQWLREALSALEPSVARSLALEEEFATIRAMIYCYEGDSAQAFEAQKALANIWNAIRALSSPDHADAGKLDAVAICKKLAPYLGATETNDWTGLKDDDAISMTVKMRVGDLRTLKAVATDEADAGKVEGDGWLPIESAPKDGTVIDLWSDEYGRLTDCYWGAPMAYEGGETGWVHAHSNEWAESPDEFIHWRPLPLPPVKGGQNG